MAKLKMKWVRIYALRSQRKPLLEWLQRAGMLEIEAGEDPEEGFVRLVKEEEAAGFERSATAAKQALAALDEVAPDKKGLLSAFTGRREMPLEEFEGYAGRSVEIMQDCRRLLNMQKRRAECAAERARIKNALDQLEPWRELDVPFGFTGTKTAAAFIGSLPAAYTQAELAARLAGHGLLVLTAGPALRLLPPLTITKGEMDQGLAILDRGLE